MSAVVQQPGAPVRVSSRLSSRPSPPNPNSEVLFVPAREGHQAGDGFPFPQSRFFSTILSDPDAHPQNKRPRAREFDRRPTAALRPPCFDHDATRVRRPLQLNPCTQLMQLKRPSKYIFVVVWVCWGNGGLCLCCVVSSLSFVTTTRARTPARTHPHSQKLTHHPQPPHPHPPQHTHSQVSTHGQARCPTGMSVPARLSQLTRPND